MFKNVLHAILFRSTFVVLLLAFAYSAVGA